MVRVTQKCTDRPGELRETGANQTIRQDRFFANYVRWQTELPCATQGISPAMVLTTVDQAVYQSQINHPGPVHLNCRFREPLEVLVLSEMPCGGTADCGVCSVAGRKGWLLPCSKGPVFQASTLMRLI